MDDRIREKMEAQLRASPVSALERLREFLLYYVHSTDRDLLKLEAEKRPSVIIDAVEAIEDVLAAPPPPGTLHHMVTHEGNRMLDDETDETAAAWLRKLTVDLRQWLGAYAPATRDTQA